MATPPLILVVEDDDALRYALTRQLKLLGYDSHSATNGKEALEMFDGHTYRAVLMDLMMPIMDGLTTTRHIRERERQLESPALPIIAVTALYDKEKCLDAGMNDFLFKPVLLDDLAAKLALWIPNDSQHQTA